jgi:hypothetical protein
MKAGYVLTKLDDEANGLSDWRPVPGGVGIGPWLEPESFEPTASGSVVGRVWTNLLAGKVELKGNIILGHLGSIGMLICTLPLELRPKSIRWIIGINLQADIGQGIPARAYGLTFLIVHPDGRVTNNGTFGSGPGQDIPMAEFGGVEVDGVFYSIDD